MREGKIIRYPLNGKGGPKMAGWINALSLRHCQNTEMYDI